MNKIKLINLIKNKEPLKIYNSNSRLLIISREREISVILSSFLGSALSIKKKIGVFVLSTKKKNTILPLIYQSFGFKKFINVKDNEFFTFNYFFKTIYLFFSTYLKIKSKGITWFTSEFRIDNIYVGDLIYDSYIRYDLSFLNNKPTKKFYIILLTAIINFYRMKNIILKKKINIIISEGGAYSNFSGLSKRIADKYNIRVLCLNHDLNTQCFILSDSKLLKKTNGYKKGTNYNKNKFFINKKLILNFCKSLSEKELDKFFEKRTKGKINSVRTNRNDLLNSKKNSSSNQYYSRKTLLEKVFKDKTNKRIILIAPHAFSDAPHHDKFIFFKDFYDQFQKTINFIHKNNLNHVNWLVRPHPSSNIYGEKNVTANFLKKFNSKHIKLAPHDISSKNVTELCDGVVTCTGTISLEFAIKGKFSINAGICPYSNFGVTIDCRNQEEYFRFLEKVDKIDRLNKSKILLAKKIFYFLENYISGKEIKKSNLVNLIAPLNNFKSKNINYNDVLNSKFVNYLIKKPLSNDVFFKSLSESI